ncbi:LysE family translocator [Antrihabitans sp. YC2-6]|uniref:LysE family translocator n=1 Tax=Antrihabitans sp. YC2-6 TaxID=2799498 RepID=UPI0018F7817B|nr:LysE family translocator [Antrihabitans sp. YC2-6]MBJ8344232.1 LysE family translocator [Antrihabitans sp. YC2-6]
MLTTSAMAGVGAIALGMVLTPGPNMMYLVSRSITQGRAAGLVSLAGVAAGFLVYLMATTVGITALFVAVPQLYLAVKLAGACYLLWLAWQAVRPGGFSVFEARSLPHDSRRRLFTMGLLTNLLNPKIAIMYLALIPQFIDVDAGAVWLQSLALGGVQIAIALTVNALIVCGAAVISSFLTQRPAWLRAQRWVMGTVLGGLAINLATDRARPAMA